LNTWQISLLLAFAILVMVAGIRFSRPFATIAGFAIAGLVAFAHVTARFGPELVWFRAPTFYVAAWTLLGGVVWWLRRPVSSRLRFGVLAGAFVLGGAMLAFALLNGRGTPAAMLMPTLNQPAPDLSFRDAAGRSRKLSELKGDVVLLNFWATWCAPCRKEMPLLAKLQRAHAHSGFRVVYLSLEEPQVLDAFWKTHQYDGTAGRLIAAPPFYDAGKFYPLSYLISRDGRVVKRWSGRPDEAWLDDSIRRAL
jgi:cytochrome c biogenesis protein CcmG, thiol:disulfide interchange protein DsbE